MTEAGSRASLIERAARIYDFTAARDELRATLEAARPEEGLSTGEDPSRRAPLRYAASPGSAAIQGERVVGEPRRAPGRGARIDRDALRDKGFILPDAAVSALAEEFRIVKRQLLLAARDGNDRGRMILIVSAQPNEGKTFCAVNLALSLAAEKDVHVLLVDADFAKPEVLSTLGLENGPGLIDALTDPSVDVEDCVIGTDIPNLAVLPAGRQTNEATELLASERTRAILDRLLADDPARIILFDSAPALAASPASVLALHVGQAVLVVRADRTSEAELKGAIELIGGHAPVRLLLNGVSFAAGGRRFGAYYGYGA